MLKNDVGTCLRWFDEALISSNLVNENRWVSTRNCLYIIKGPQFVATKLGWQLKFAHPILHELFPTCILVDMSTGLLEKTGYLESSTLSTSGNSNKLFADKSISLIDGRVKISLGTLCSWLLDRSSATNCSA
jgi:hypothetical protein